jgi:hypothetical protein
VEAPTHKIYGLFSLQFNFGNYCMDNLIPGGAVRGIGGTLDGKDGESAVVILRFLCDSPRLCRLKI